MSPCYDHVDDLQRLRALHALKPDTFNAVVEFNRKAFENGALSVKVKELIAVATAHVSQCAYCIDDHTTRVPKAGATDAEIPESISVAMAMRAGGTWAQSATAMQALEA